MSIVRGININTLNDKMREAYHSAGHVGENIIICLVGSGVNKKGPLAKEGLLIAGSDQAFIDHRKHDTSMAYLYNLWLPGAKIIVYQAFPDGEPSVHAVKSAMRDILSRAKADRKHLYMVSMSLSGPDLKDEEGDNLGKQLTAARAMVGCSAGNTGTDASDISYFAAYEWPYTCTNAKPSGNISATSSRLDTADFIDLGDNVPVLLASGQMGTMSGTSISVVQMWAKAGLMQSCYYDQTGRWWEDERLYTEMKTCALDLGSKDGWDPETGWGVIYSMPAKYEEAATPEPEPEPEPVEDTPTNTDRRARLISAVLANMALMVGTPYSQEYRNRIWPGGSGSADCSSLVAATWSAAGYPLLNSAGDELRTSYRQVAAVGFDLIYPASTGLIGKNLPSPSGLLGSYGAQAGDIVFWNFDSGTTRANKITHVGMIDVGAAGIIHTANPRENACRKPLSYGDTHICAIIRLRSDFVYPTLPEIRRPADGVGRADEWLVRMLQTALNFKRGTQLVIDGDFGSKTEAEVTALNATFGVNSGVCKAATWAALGIVNNGDEAPAIPTGPSTPAGNAAYAQTMGTVRLRTGPGTDHESIGTSDNNAPLLTMPALENGWRETAVAINGHLQVGYMSGKYIQVI
jgi:cell wall-associated NlpC family hydrolase